MSSLWQRRSLLIGYWQYWLNAVNQHSLHAPFIYDFYQKVIQEKSPASDFQAIEQYRATLLKSEDWLSIPSLGATSLVSQSSSRKVKSIARHSLSTPKFGRFLYRLVQFQQPSHIVELGTSLGITSLYLSFANDNTMLYTLEGSSDIAAVAKQSFSHFHRENIELRKGNIDQTLPTLLKELPQIDLAYVDANHRLQPTLCYFSQLLTKTHKTSILIFDDIHWSVEMQQAWQKIIQHPRVTLSIDLFDAGIVFFRPLATKQHYFLMF
ncbi:MAG: class I SAM-dependent methyltransferase [Bacteroidota bacterium]